MNTGISIPLTGKTLCLGRPEDFGGFSSNAGADIALDQSAITTFEVETGIHRVLRGDSIGIESLRRALERIENAPLVQISPAKIGQIIIGKLRVGEMAGIVIQGAIGIGASQSVSESAAQIESLGGSYSAIGQGALAGPPGSISFEALSGVEGQIGYILRKGFEAATANTEDGLWLTPQVLGASVAVLLNWAGPNNQPQINLNIPLLSIGFQSAGWHVFSAIKKLDRATRLGVRAMNKAELDDAAEIFTEVISSLGLDVFLASILKDARQVSLGEQSGGGASLIPQGLTSQGRRLAKSGEIRFLQTSEDEFADQSSDTRSRVVEYLREVQEENRGQERARYLENLQRQEDILNHHRQKNRAAINFSSGSAKGALGYAAHVRLWFAHNDFKVFLHDVTEVATDLAVNDHDFAATLTVVLLDGKVDKGAAYNLGQFATSFVATRGIKPQTWAGFFGKVGLNGAFQLTGAGYDSAFQAYNALVDAGIDPTTLPRDQIKAISLGILAEANFTYDAQENILTAEYLHVREDENEFKVQITTPIRSNAPEE